MTPRRPVASSDLGDRLFLSKSINFQPGPPPGSPAQMGVAEPMVGLPHQTRVRLFPLTPYARRKSVAVTLVYLRETSFNGHDALRARTVFLSPPFYDPIRVLTY